MSESAGSSTSNGNAKKSLKRKNCLDWEDFFMATACLAAKRSKDPKWQVGACIVNDDNKIVGVGYNGFPRGCSDDEFSWGKSDEWLQNKHLFVCHAEMNAILNAANCSSVKGCKMYVALFPCNECAKIIIQSGIKEVIYISDKNHDTEKAAASRAMLNAAGVIYSRYSAKQNIVIDFSLGQQT